MNILIVEDKDESRYMLESLLKGSGYEVVSAKNGVEALQLLKKGSIDMIISDILMPKMDGYQLCRECKSDDTLRKTPFVFYTATYTDKKDEEFALSLGAEKFIVKPVEPDKFLEILEAVIEEHEAGTLAAPKRPVEDETVYLAEYNKRLIEKLEKKMLDLEKENTERKKAEEKIEKLAKFPSENPNPVLRIGSKGTILYKNEATDVLLNESGLAEEDIFRILPDNLKKLISKALKTKKAFYDLEAVVGDKVYSYSLFPVVEGQYVNLYAIDVTERKRAAEEVERLAKFPSENPNPVLRISSNGLILYSNKAALPLLKAWDCRRKDQLLSGRWYQYVLDALSCGGDQQAEVECGKRIFSLTFAPVADSNYVNVYALDITKRKRAEERLLEDKKQLRSLTSELSLTEERERRRVAEGLHDSIIQPLVFLDIKLEALKKSAKQRGLIDSLDEMRTTIGELIEMTRGFTFDLSSSVVYELGLEAAIEEWLTTNIREKYAIATIFEDDGQSKSLDDDMHAFLFKAVRELLVNVVKHAGADNVRVSVARDEDKIKICVEDDGAGFEYLKKKAGLSGSSGYGLFSIRERLHYLGGSFDIESKLGHGTRVALTSPLKCDS